MGIVGALCGLCNDTLIIDYDTNGPGVMNIRRDVKIQATAIAAKPPWPCFQGSLLFETEMPSLRVWLKIRPPSPHLRLTMCHRTPSCTASTPMEVGHRATAIASKPSRPCLQGSSRCGSEMLYPLKQSTEGSGRTPCLLILPHLCDVARRHQDMSMLMLAHGRPNSQIFHRDHLEELRGRTRW